MTQDTITQPDPQPVVAEEVTTYENYWGVKEAQRFYLPDGKQYFDILPLNEGMKTRFQKLTNKGIRMNQRSQEAILDVDAANERHTLILESVVSWFIMHRDPKDPSGFSEYICPSRENDRKKKLEELLMRFNPKVVQDLEFFIRTKNPWMQDDMNIDEIDKEIERLQELRQQVKERQQGESDSANK